MKEVRFDTAENKATDAFFDEYPYEYSPLQSFAESAKVSTLNEDELFATRQKPLANFLKQVFLFFPGAFILFYVSLGTTLFLGKIIDNLDEKHLLFYLVGLCAFVMTWVGLGDIKNKKHAVVPVSIILSNAAIGVIVLLTRDFLWIAERIFYDFDYAVCLLPVSLTVPFLAKGWIDSNSEFGIRNSD